jgi:hypothetical protein
MEGRMYLLRAMKDWCEVGEIPSWSLFSLIVCIASISLSRIFTVNRRMTGMSGR